MRLAHRPHASLAAALVGGPILAAASLAGADEAASSALKWTPHRAAVASVPAGTPAVDAGVVREAPRVPADAVLGPPPQVGTASQTPPYGPPASVALPADVPRLPSAPRGDQYAPLRRGVTAPPMPWSGTTFGSLSSSNPFTPTGMASFFNRDFTRAPQADTRRQPAPGWTAAGSSRAGRPERLAMNADGIPSVMARTQRPPTVDGLPTPTGESSGASDARSAGGPAGALEGTEIITMPPASGDLSDGMMMPGSGFGSGFDPGFDPMLGDAIGSGEMLSDYPAYYHVESFYDDPYACEDDECQLPVFQSHGRICTWLRQFGKPYYGWRWYRDFTASAGVMSFTNSTDLGINGNYGTNEYVNWALPFWNAFGVGWQVGARATQSNFNPTVLTTPTGGTLTTNARNQVFVTTGFFTRAFEGRGFQGGAVYDYLNDSWFDEANVAQLRTELSYVWGYHEIGYWGAYNIGEEQSLFGPVLKNTAETSTLDLYTAFYRVQFGDANEWKFYGGGTGQGDGVVGSFVRAPMARSWSLEGTFNYIIPGSSRVIDVDGAGTTLRVSPDAWNVGVNVVFSPAGRSRRGLASPYRPLFEVADNGSMIRTIGQ